MSPHGSVFGDITVSAALHIPKTVLGFVTESLHQETDTNSPLLEEKKVVPLQSDAHVKVQSTKIYTLRVIL